MITRHQRLITREESLITRHQRLITREESLIMCHQRLITREESLMENFSKNAPSTTSERVVRVYLETRYDIYQSKGSINAVEEYISGILNQLSALFQKEGISLNISKIYI